MPCDSCLARPTRSDLLLLRRPAVSGVCRELDRRGQLQRLGEHAGLPHWGPADDVETRRHRTSQQGKENSAYNVAITGKLITVQVVCTYSMCVYHSCLESGRTAVGGAGIQAQHDIVYVLLLS